MEGFPGGKLPTEEQLKNMKVGESMEVELEDANVIFTRAAMDAKGGDSLENTIARSLADMQAKAAAQRDRDRDEQLAAMKDAERRALWVAIFTRTFERAKESFGEGSSVEEAEAVANDAVGAYRRNFP